MFISTASRKNSLAIAAAALALSLGAISATPANATTVSPGGNVSFSGSVHYQIYDSSSNSVVQNYTCDTSISGNLNTSGGQNFSLNPQSLTVSCLDYYGFPVVQSTDSAWSGNFYVGPNGHSVYSNISVNNITIEVDTGGFGPPASATCAGTIGPMWWNGADVTTGANATQLSISSATLPNTNSRSTWVCKMNGNLYLSPFQSFH